MASQSYNVKIKGLYLHPNNLSECPQGALYAANNCLIDKESIIEPRRGQKIYSNQLGDSNTIINKLFTYKDKIICDYDNKLAIDNNGTLVDFDGTFSQITEKKRHSVQANSNLYLTSASGVIKLDDISSQWLSSGGVKALDGVAQLNSATGGFLPTDRQIAYRIVWGYKDANQNLIIGAPSSRIIVVNNSGSNKNIDLSITIPAEITTSDFYQIYRSNESADATSEPDDELQLVIEDFPTSTQITNGIVDVTDLTLNDLKGAFLYTSPSQEGIAASNEKPPMCCDLASFKNHTFYANTTSLGRQSLTFISVGNTSFNYQIKSCDTTLDSYVVTTSNTSGISVGQRVVAAGIPSNSTVVSFVANTSVTLSNKATATGTVSLEFQDYIKVKSFQGTSVFLYGGSSSIVANNQFKVTNSLTPAENIESTAREFCLVANKVSNNTFFNAFYMSAYDQLPGKILLEEKIFNQGFYTSSNTGVNFIPTIPSVDNSLLCDVEVRKNRVFISKPLQPEAVPLGYYLDIGSREEEIVRILALRDSLMVFKNDGVYRITGEDISSFRVSLLDSTTTIKCPESAVTFNNQVFFFSDQGICAASDTGIQIVSRPIESTLLQLSSSLYPNFESVSFAIAYESSRLYMFFTVTNKFDTFATQAYVYNSATNSWTRWIMDRTCGLVNPDDDKLYMGSSNRYIYKERKDFTRFDYADEEFPLVITDVDQYDLTKITVEDISGLEIGQNIKQGNNTANVIAIDTQNNWVYFDKIQSWIVGSCDRFLPIPVKMQWLPIDCGNSGVTKQFREVTFFFRDASFRNISSRMSTNFSLEPEETLIETAVSGEWGSFGWGNLPWGGGSVAGGQSIRTYVPLEKQRGSWLNMSVESSQCFVSLQLQGFSLIFNQTDTRQK